MDGNPAGSKKRKTPDSVTLNACTNCKKARSKCDGQKPACKRYQLLAEMERLRTENHHLAQRNRALNEKNGMMEHIFQSLSYGKHSDKIIHRLERGECQQSIVD
ncbi:MAG: hypothetical protein Q9173_007307 [Seirophora scorigena]